MGGQQIPTPAGRSQPGAGSAAGKVHISAMALLYFLPPSWKPTSTYSPVDYPAYQPPSVAPNYSKLPTRYSTGNGVPIRKPGWNEKDRRPQSQLCFMTNIFGSKATSPLENFATCFLRAAIWRKRVHCWQKPCRLGVKLTQEKAKAFFILFLFLMNCIPCVLVEWIFLFHANL